MNNDKLVKVALETANNEDDEIIVETPWALELGSNQFQLKNFPFYFYGLSFDDVFEAMPKYENDDRPYFSKVVEKSGHKTLRIILSESLKESLQSQLIISKLEAMDCGYEGTNGEVYFVVNIQPHCDFWSVCNFLTENNVNWEHADPTYEDIYPES